MMSGTAALKQVQCADYQDIAGEYYNSKLHPTCASFRELSRKYLIPRLERISGAERLLETGAGRSIVAPLWLSLDRSLDDLILLDKSPDMLSYSAEWGSKGARLVIGDAERTGLPSDFFDVVVSSLGDPYNTTAYWSEIARLLRPGGSCHFTAPAHEWAEAFRSHECRTAAEFVRSDGTVLWMPSPVFTEQEQEQLFSRAGLRILETEALTISDLPAHAAPKLLCVSATEPVLRGYSVTR